jgi:hypothetical protein
MSNEGRESMADQKMSFSGDAKQELIASADIDDAEFYGDGQAKKEDGE